MILLFLIKIVELYWLNESEQGRKITKGPANPQVLPPIRLSSVQPHNQTVQVSLHICTFVTKFERERERERESLLAWSLDDLCLIINAIGKMMWFITQ